MDAGLYLAALGVAIVAAGVYSWGYIVGYHAGAEDCEWA